jgi:hypothetical protein
MKLKTGPPTKEQMRKRIDREREAGEKKKKKKLKEARLTPAQRLLTKKAETQIKKDDPKAFEPGQGSKYQEPTKKHVGIIKGRLETAKRKTEGMKNKIEVQKVKQIKVKRPESYR